MTNAPPPVAETDLIDYVNGALSLEQRIVVADFLASHPQAAVQVMAELKLRDELRLALAPVATAPPRWRRFAVPLALAASAGMAVAGGWVTLGAPAPPSYVDLAVNSHANSRLRLAMPSQVETRHVDPADIWRATGIRLPDLPPNWRISDVQVYPSPLGPTVEIAVQTPDNGLLSVFAVRLEADGTTNPKAGERDGRLLAFFQVDGTGYAVVGTTARAPLDDEARLLFDTLI